MNKPDFSIGSPLWLQLNNGTYVDPADQSPAAAASDMRNEVKLQVRIGETVCAEVFNLDLEDFENWDFEAQSAITALKASVVRELINLHIGSAATP